MEKNSQVLPPRRARNEHMVEPLAARVSELACRGVGAGVGRGHFLALPYATLNGLIRWTSVRMA